MFRTLVPRLPLCLIGMALLAPCGGSAERGPDAVGSAESAGAMVPTLTVRVAGDAVELELRVANGGGSPVVLEFGTAQRYDFAVSSEAGEEVWRWSGGQGFAQSAGRETVEAGGTLEYRAVWDAAGRTGRYRAEARLVSTSRPLRLVTGFEVGS